MKTVTFKGAPGDINRVRDKVSGLVFKAGVPTQDVPDDVIERLKQLTGHRFEYGDPPSEAVQNKAEELGVDLSGVEGSGQGGSIVVKDVEAAARDKENANA